MKRQTLYPTTMTFDRGRSGRSLSRNIPTLQLSIVATREEPSSARRKPGGQDLWIRGNNRDLSRLETFFEIVHKTEITILK
jgi:hypothetical protein